MAGPILFVCRGNHCRSPMAEGAMRLAARRAGLQIECDSAGTAPEREGEPPDWRARMVAGKYGADISGKRSRAVTRVDFTRFALILAMDAHNLADLHAMAPKGGAVRVALLQDMVRGRVGKGIRDPYRGSVADFYDCWRHVFRATQEVASRLAI